VGLDVHLSPSIQVAKMANDSFEVLPSPTEHFDHHFRSTADRATNELYLGLRQVITPARPAASVGRNVEQRLGPKINESSGHVPAPNSADWPSARPSRGPGVLPPPSALP